MVKDSKILDDVRGSDHVPIELIIIPWKIIYN